tara:strand:+ start:212 stop:358 length:147 start_codon:yes stop_codon:yes gene_type:complete
MLHVSREKLWAFRPHNIEYPDLVAGSPLLKTNGLAGQRHLFNRKEVAC